ncbi:hypothetical protein NQ314_013670 [Rhamnusium bicolor]|uniref:Nuclease HARBI1 n=1 Tax=Rhamnusium bicolor TaxID=1586634 RepID=A0AAV8X4W1_9CUCU|nr:hypothetical protein NQ314_013670 [Rhamnusium bicolor]
MAHYILNIILPTISTKTSVLAIQPSTSFFSALYFNATGSYLRIVGQSYNISMSQQTVSRAIMEVTSAIVTVLGQEWIRFPTIVEEKNVLKAHFMQSAGFPGAIVAIECTHIEIIAPAIEEHNYLNRKGFH